MSKSNSEISADAAAVHMEMAALWCSTNCPWHLYCLWCVELCNSCISAYVIRNWRGFQKNDEDFHISSSYNHFFTASLQRKFAIFTEHIVFGNQYILPTQSSIQIWLDFEWNVSTENILIGKRKFDIRRILKFNFWLENLRSMHWSYYWASGCNWNFRIPCNGWRRKNNMVWSAY